MTSPIYDAVLFDLDGVLTSTAALHARCWKVTFDSVLAQHGQEPFDIERDYVEHVDGKMREDGVRDFLRSRGIEAAPFTVAPDRRPQAGAGGAGAPARRGSWTGPRLGGVIESLVEQIEARYAEVQQQMSDPEVISDRQRYADAGRQFNQLAPAAKLAEEWRRATSDAEGAQEMLDEGMEDAELRDELRAARERIEELEEEIRLAMVETDPNDDKNVIVEIRGGAGGDEAGLWAGDLFRMLTRYAERLGLQTETMDATDGSYTFEVRGDGAFSRFKYEGGTHRVQRVPATESQGRIHTSTATVAVLPEAEDVEVEIDQNDLEIDVYRSSGPGGQSVNTTDSAVRITHKPTGLVVSMQDEKSQLQNRERAMKVLRARLYEQKVAEQQAELAADRRAQVGTGERAEKIRTYNFPQRRVTDHRVEGLTVHNLEQVLAGELDDITGALQDAEKRKRLELQAAG
jgi:peptide chain release factor 1